MATDELQKFRKVLMDNGHSLTKAREQTFLLLLSPEPQSMNQLLTKAAGKLDRVSVYRNVDLFEKLGIVHRIYIGWKYKLELSDQFVSHHHHLTCLGCGKVIDIEDDVSVNRFVDSVAQEFGFAPRNHQFEINGYCQNCR